MGAFDAGQARLECTRRGMAAVPPAWRHAPRGCVQRIQPSELTAFRVRFGERARASFSRLAMNSRSAAAVGLPRRGARVLAGDMGGRASIFSKLRRRVMSRRLPTTRYENTTLELPPISRTSKLAAVLPRT